MASERNGIVRFISEKKHPAKSGGIYAIQRCKTPHTEDDFDIATKHDSGWFSQSGLAITPPHSWALLIGLALRGAPILACCPEWLLHSLD